jgi:hypothetical protein
MNIKLQIAALGTIAIIVIMGWVSLLAWATMKLFS